MPARRYSGERRHRHHHHHHLGGYGMRRVHHHHHHGTGHRRLNTWQVFVKTHMRPGQTLRHLAQMYHGHHGHVGVHRKHRIYHRKAMSY